MVDLRLPLVVGDLPEQKHLLRGRVGDKTEVTPAVLTAIVVVCLEAMASAGCATSWSSFAMPPAAAVDGQATDSACVLSRPSYAIND